MARKVLIELIIWIVSISIALILWSPIFTQIPYKYLPLGVVAIVTILQFARWYIQYDYVVLFQKKYLKLICIAFIPFLSFVIWSEGQKIIALSENMDIVDIVSANTSYKAMSLDETYQLFSYLKHLLILCNFGTPALGLMLLLKIIYKTMGMGSERVRKFVTAKG